MADSGHKPTSGMKSAAKRALAWHKEGKRGGTSVGYARANQIVSGESLSDDTVKRMYSFFSRHEVDKKATGFNSGEEGYPSPGRVAWDLWGGDAGFAFARSKVKHTIKKMIMDEIDDLIKSSNKKIKVGQMVSWGSSGGNATGKVVKVKKNGTIKVPDSSFTITGTKDNPAVLIRIYKDGKPTETLVGHKMNTLNSIKKTIGGNSSMAKDPNKDPMPEEYARGGDKINMSEKDKVTTEPDPKGDVAVTKSVDSDLARRKITKAIKSLEKALAGLPDVGRADSVSVSNETAPVAKAADAPNVGRADSVSVSNETAPVTKDVGDANNVKGDGDNSQVANTTVNQPAGVVTKAESCGPDCTGDDCTKCAAMGITKAACCDDCGDNCTTNKECCTKCMKMNKSDSVPSPSSSGAVMASVDELEKAAGDDDSDAGSEPDDDADDKDIKKSIWGGAFGPTYQSSIGIVKN
jgi:hypothetical protein